MKSILESADGNLSWVPSRSFKRDSELRHGDEVFATLEWQNAYKASALAVAATEAWTFRLEGFVLKQWVVAADAGTGETRGMFQAAPSMNGHFDGAGGDTWYWDSNFWLTKWLWTDREGIELARVSRNLTILPEGNVEITPEGLAIPTLPLLLCLGWYLIIVMTDLRPG